jgi:hypothetical protein
MHSKYGRDGNLSSRLNPEKEKLCANPTSIAMIGYNFEHDDEFGLCLAAVRQLTIALDGGNAEDRAY